MPERRPGGILRFRNQLGTFDYASQPGPLGAGYVVRWEQPSGRVLTDARIPHHPTASSAGYLNNPADGTGLGAFGMYVAFDKPPWRYSDTAWQDPREGVKPGTAWCVGSRRVGWPGVAWVSDADTTDTTVSQGLALMRGQVIVRVKWEFRPKSVRHTLTVRFAPSEKVEQPRPWYVKEPEVGYCFDTGSRFTAIETPGTRCRTYDGLTDPRRRTGRCEDPSRTQVLLRGSPSVRIRFDDDPWRKLADTMRTWTPAGDQPCPGATGTRIHSNWEYPAWAPAEKLTHRLMPYSSLVVLAKGTEGCVNALDFSHGYRAPRETRPFRLQATIATA